jgi:hypothetical protein
MTERLRRSEYAKWIVIAALVAAVLAPFIALHYYSGPLVWPGLVGNFTASLIAFLVALAWDRREKQRERVDEEAMFAQRAQEAEDEEVRDRREEAQRRFRVILKELRVNAKSFEDASGSLSGRIVIPQLLDGSWIASGAALSAIASDYELVAALSTFYGRVRELQWRLRKRLEIASPGGQQFFDAMTEPLIVELKEEVAELIPRVEAQVDDPQVIEVPLISSRTVVFGPAVAAWGQGSSRRVTRASPHSRPIGPPYE